LIEGFETGGAVDGFTEVGTLGVGKLIDASAGGTMIGTLSMGWKTGKGGSSTAFAGAIKIPTMRIDIDSVLIF
jgi:hypothetical protein